MSVASNPSSRETSYPKWIRPYLLSEAIQYLDKQLGAAGEEPEVRIRQKGAIGLLALNALGTRSTFFIFRGRASRVQSEIQNLTQDTLKMLHALIDGVGILSPANASAELSLTIIYNSVNAQAVLKFPPRLPQAMHTFLDEIVKTALKTIQVAQTNLIAYTKEEIAKLEKEPSLAKKEHTLEDLTVQLNIIQELTPEKVLYTPLSINEEPQVEDPLSDEEEIF